MNQRACAHGTGLNCSKQFAVSQAMLTHDSTGFPQCHDFCMGSRIGIGDISIPTATHDPAVTHHYRANGNFACVQGSLSSAQGLFHPQFVAFPGQFQFLHRSGLIVAVVLNRAASG
jgi:hypothetical protein